MTPLMDEPKNSENSSENTPPPATKRKIRLYPQLFMAVLLIAALAEIITLLPGYYALKTSQLEHIKEESLKVVQGITAFQSGTLAVTGQVSLPAPLYGLAFYNTQGERLTVVAGKGQPAFPEKWGGLLVRPQDNLLHWVYWENSVLGGDYHVVALVKQIMHPEQDGKEWLLMAITGLSLPLLIALAIMQLLRSRLAGTLQQLASVMPAPPGRGDILTRLALWLDRLIQDYRQNNETLENKKKQLRATNLVLEMQVAQKHSLEQANQLKTRFLADIAQKMRAAMAEFMATDSTGNAHSQSAIGQSIQGNGQHLLEILDDLMDLSRLEAGLTDYTPEETDLGGLIREVERAVQDALTEKSLKLTREFMTRQLIVTCDRNKIRRVFINIIDNGIRFSPQGGEIKVGFRRFYDELDDEWLSCTFQDQGPGIAEEELENIFNQYFQQSRPDPKSAHTGMGLAICKEIIEAHGGSIHAENHPEGGTCLVVHLPMKSGLELGNSDNPS